MARALVLEPDKTELRVALQRGCGPVVAETVTLTITRMEPTCSDVLPPLESCCHRIPLIVLDRRPTKVYHAIRIESGLAVFALDHDLSEAPEGWYLGRVAVDGCEAAVLTIWMRCGGVAARAHSPD